MTKSIRRGVPFRGCLWTLLCVISTAVWAQTTQNVEVKHAKVVYVSGNDLVVKTAEGKVKHFVVPKNFKFTVDGKQVSTQDLKPGTQLTQTITTTTTERAVTKVQKVSGKVWQVNPPYVIVTLADGKNKQFKVPDGTKFNIEGEQKTVFDLQPGTNLNATIVTSTPETDVARKSKVVGKAPLPPTPEVVGVLLIEEVDVVAP